MRAYLITTAIMFAAIAIAHVARVFAESTLLARDPWFVGLTFLAIGMCVWALRLLRQKAT